MVITNHYYPPMAPINIPPTIFPTQCGTYSFPKKNFAIHTTQPLNQWKTIIAIMLEKDKGSAKINKLQVIGKYEADYNLLLKLYWPKLTIQHAEREGTLEKRQLGTRPHKSSNDASVINELIVDTCRIQECILTIKQNDASVCYDSIIPNHSSLNIRREGTPKKVCQLRVNTLNFSKYHVQPPLGVSKQYYTHTDESSIHGSGQGTGSAETEWALISIPIIKVLEQTTIGFATKNPNNKKEWKTSATAFVDDAQLFSSIPRNLPQRVSTAL